MLAFGRKVIILPFRKAAGPTVGTGGLLAGLDEEDNSDALTSSPTLASYPLDLKSVISSHSVENIVDLQFLHGYNQPTLLILYEPLKTFAGYVNLGYFLQILS